MVIILSAILFCLLFVESTELIRAYLKENKMDKKKIFSAVLWALVIGVIVYIGFMLYKTDPVPVEPTQVVQTLQSDHLEQQQRSGKAWACEYMYSTQEYLDITQIITFGNQTKKLTYRNFYFPTVLRTFEILGKNNTTQEEYRAMAEPYFTGAVVDSVFNVKRTTKKCYVKFIPADI